MDTDNLMLVAGTYADAGAAAEDFKTLKAGRRPASTRSSGRS